MAKLPESSLGEKKFLIQSHDGDHSIKRIFRLFKTESYTFIRPVRTKAQVDALTPYWNALLVVVSNPRRGGPRTAQPAAATAAATAAADSSTALRQWRTSGPPIRRHGVGGQAGREFTGLCRGPHAGRRIVTLRCRLLATVWPNRVRPPATSLGWRLCLRGALRSPRPGTGVSLSQRGLHPQGPDSSTLFPNSRRAAGFSRPPTRGLLK